MGDGDAGDADNACGEDCESPTPPHFLIPTIRPSQGPVLHGRALRGMARLSCLPPPAGQLGTRGGVRGSTVLFTTSARVGQISPTNKILPFMVQHILFQHGPISNEGVSRIEGIKEKNTPI